MITLQPIKFNTSSYTGEVISESLLAGLPEEITNIRFAKFKDEVNVSILLFRKGETTPISQISCSAPLSKVLKAAKAKGTSTSKLLGIVLGCPVHQLTSEKGEKYQAVVQPANFDPEGLEITKDSVVSWNELVAL